ncbi:unnamed protein product, partial [Closterium sp. Naga37s-1]
EDAGEQTSGSRDEGADMREKTVMWRGQQGETANGALRGTQQADTTWCDQQQWAEQHFGSSIGDRGCTTIARSAGEAGIAIPCGERPAGDELIIVVCEALPPHPSLPVPPDPLPHTPLPDPLPMRPTYLNNHLRRV